MQAPEDAGGLSGDLELISEAARLGASIAMRYFRADPEVWLKQGNSPVSEADLAVDKALKDILLAARPDYGWLSEETADDPRRLAHRRTFVVDPIDGTRAFLQGSSEWCVSIAVVEDGRGIAGVLDVPALRTRYRAMRGHGAWRDAARIAVGPAVGPLRIAGPGPMVERARQTVAEPIRRMAYVPSLALRLAMVAAGDLDGTLVKSNAHDWDIAAADVIVAEAGGVILESTGKSPGLAGADPRRDELVAGSPAVAGLLLPVLRPGVPG